MPKTHIPKLLFSTRILLIMLIVTIMHVSAASVAQTITYTNPKVQLSQLFKVIKSQTGYNVVWYEGSLDVAKTINVNFKKTPIEDVMNQVLKSEPLTFTIDQKTIIIKEKEKPASGKPKASAQTILTGTVYDEQNQALPGVAVRIKGAKEGVITNEKGLFNLPISDEGAMLVFSFIGYETKEVQSIANIKVFMKRSNSKLDEIQIMAYGTTTQRLNTGDITSVKAADIAMQPVSNPLAALEGRVPGLVVTQSSGVVGSTYKIQLRGQGSLLQGTDPLFIIDGVPFAPGNTPLNTIANATSSGGNTGISPLYMINPADIESIDVLKDADATSIYGSRGANGVILVTTKKGRSGKTKIDANLYNGWSKITHTMDMLNTQQYLEMRKEAFKNDGVTMTNDNAPDLLLWDTTRYTDFKKLLTGNTAHTTDGQITVSGGNINTQFIVGGAYHDETTVFPGAKDNSRASAHFGLNHQSMDKKFSLGLTAIYASNASNLTGVDLTSYIGMPPNLLLYDKNGNLNWQEGGVYYTGLITNPLAMTNNLYTGKYQNTNANLVLAYEIIKGLKIKNSAGYNSVTTNEQSLNPSTSINPNSGVLPSSNFSTSAIKSWIVEPQLEYNDYLLKGEINVLVGSTFQDNSFDNISVLAQNYNSDILLGSIAAAGNLTSTNSNNEYRYTAFYGRVNYTWNDKYLLNITGRRDGSSRFGPDKQFANFGAVGLAWVFSSETFVKNTLPFLSFGKLRGSYGTTGNDQIGNYKYLNTWTNTTQGYQGVPGLQPTSLFNANFAWESNRKSEISLDLGALKDRILLSATYFNNRSGNQLINYKLPAQTGFAQILRNLDAVIENSGLEFTATTRNIDSKSFSWNTSINLTFPQNKLIAFPGLETSTYANTYILGQPLSTRKTLQYLGVDSQTGIYQFTDVNKDGVLDATDKILTENTQPQYYGGIQNSFRYKGLQLDIFLEFKKQKGYNYLYTQANFIPGYYYMNQPTIVLQRWQKPGDIAPIQKFTATGAVPVYTAGFSNLVSSDGIFSDASYIRVKNVALSYSLRPAFCKKIHIDGLRIYLQGQNLWTITNYIGADPENQNLFVLPPLRTITTGLQLTL